MGDQGGRAHLAQHGFADEPQLPDGAGAQPLPQRPGQSADTGRAGQHPGKPYTPENYLEKVKAEHPDAFVMVHPECQPEIVDMANYYASRGWVFISIDYEYSLSLKGNIFF